MTRNATPDILGEIMGAPKPENNKEIKQSNTKTSKPENNKEIKQSNKLAIEQEDKNTITSNKEKTTFNISTQILEHLDEAWFKMKKMLKNKNQRITKTLIVETSIKLSLNDFSNHLEDSEVFKEITKDSS